MRQGEISILMAVYNCADTICESIDSVLSQTYTNWQFIICDDCSTDDTLTIVRDYAQKYPQKFVVIQNEKNSKLAYSLNHCLQYAQGEYCARMDGDDYIAADRFEKQVAYLQNHPDIQLVSTWMRTFGEEGLGRIIKYKENPNKVDLHKGPCFAHATMMTYTAVYQKLGGYTVSKRTVRTQDYDLWFRFFAAGFKGASIQEDLYFVREDANAFMRRKPKLYLWSIVTRAKGFKMVKMPIKYYPYILSPLVGMVGNEIRKAKVRIQRLSKGTNRV